MKPRCVKALLAIVWCWFLLPSGVAQQPPADQDEIKAEVRGLLKLHANDDFAAAQNGKYRSQFFKTLAKLAERQKVKPEEFLDYKSGQSTRSGESWGALTDGKAVEIKTRKMRYVVAILTAPIIGSPGTSIQQFVLVDESGRLLDKLAVAINSRYGLLKTELSDDPVKDGAHLIVRFQANSINKSQWHNWHTITVAGKAFTFYVSERLPQPSQWITNGLCRVAVSNGKLDVVFPKLEKSDAEVLKDKARK